MKTRGKRKDEKRVSSVSGRIAIVIVAVLAVTGGILVVLLRTNSVDESLKNDPVLKTLFVIADTAKPNGGAATVFSTDVFFYYPTLNRGALFDVPGNTGAIFSNLGRVDRIDAVYREKGIAAYRREIEALMDQQIPFTVTVTLDALCRLTDMLGGLKVFVPIPVDTVTATGDRVLLPSGSVVLDGDKIRTFLTYIPPDETQAEAQERRQKVMVALLDAFHTQSSYFQDKKTYKVFAPLFTTDMDKDDLQTLLIEISRVDAEQIHPQSVVGALQEVDGQALLFPQHDGQLLKEVTRQSVSSLLSEQDTQYNRTYVLEILNGTSTAGLARNAGSLLQIVGYQIHATSNADRQDYERTIIIDHIGNEEMVKRLGDFIRCTNIIEEEVKPLGEGERAEESLVDFTVILGKDFDGRYVR
jgi:anionic cell wall polymer biosynthesis LytR-Cps2A-Psr (LCP) family protein